jgi:hypothetical protein
MARLTVPWPRQLGVATTSSTVFAATSTRDFYLGYDHDDLDLDYFGAKRAILHFFAPATASATRLRLRGDVIASALFVSSLIVCAPPL